MEQRIPNHDDFKHPAGCVHTDFYDSVTEGVSWWEIALLTALKFSKRYVVCVVPTGFVLPTTVTQHPLAQSKEFVYISTSIFSRNELNKLSVHYYISRPKTDDRDIEVTYARIMKRYWVD